MSSIVSYKLKKSLAESFYLDVLSRRSRYYCFFGDPLSNALQNTIDYEKIVRQGIVSAKRIYAQDICYIVPRFNWSSGTVYTQYNRLLTGVVDQNGPKFYVLTSSDNTYNVYKCLNNNNNSASTIIPTGTDSSPVTYSDGYTWQFMYNIPRIMRTKFLTGDYMPVFSSLQQRFFSSGAIEDCQIVSNGQGYTQSGVYIKIEGDGVGAELRPIVIAGKIQDVIIVNSGDGYTYAKAYVIVKSGFGGVGAEISINLNAGDIESDQAIVELLAIPGTIDSIDVTNPGEGYISATVEILGDGDGATAQAVLSSGSVEKILITNRGKGYNWAVVNVIGQISPQAPTVISTVVANVSPQNGHGRSQVDDLFATQLALFTNIYSDRISDHDIGAASYSQYGIAKDFRNFDYSTFVYDQVTSKQYSIKQNFGPYISVTGGQGSGGQIFPVITGDYIEQIKIEDVGEGYSSAPTVSFSGLAPGAESPTATVSIKAELTAVNVVFPGIGLPQTPFISTQTGSAQLDPVMTQGIISVQINNQGQGYTSNPSVAFTGGGGTGAAATAEVSNGKLVKIIMTDPGEDYTTSPTVQFTGGGGTGVIATAIVGTGIIKSVSVESSNKNFSVIPTVTQDRNCGISDFIIDDSGTGFDTVTAVTFSGGGGSGLTGVPIVENCVRTITITNQGSGYTSAPAVSIQGVGTGAAATAVITNGKVTAIQITKRGWGYTVAPTITLTGGGSTTAATATATVSYGLQMIHVTNPGIGYKTAPRVSFNGAGYSGVQITPVFAMPTFTAEISGSLNSVNLIYPGKNIGNDVGIVISGSGALYPIIKGKLTSVEVINGGTGYTSKPEAVLAAESGGSAKIELTISPTTKKITSATIKNPGAGYPISSFQKYQIGDTLVDAAKNEYTVLSGSTNQNNEKMLVVRSNSGYPIYPNTLLRKKLTGYEFKTTTAMAANLVESRFPVAAIKVLASFVNTSAQSSDFQVNNILRITDQINGNKYYKILQKKELIGSSEMEFLLLPTQHNQTFAGSKINKQETLVNVQNANKQFIASEVQGADIDVYSGDILVVTNQQDSFTQNSDQSVSIRTILQF